MFDIELAGSFLIGGMILLSILALNAEIMETASLNNMGTNSQENVTTIVSILEYDFRKMGYGVPDGTDAISAMTDSTVTFLADIDDDNNVDTVAYSLSATSALSDTENPNDRYLYRSVNGTSFDVAIGIRSWNIEYYDNSGTITATAANVRSIRISFTVETPFRFDETYGSAYWVGRFTPKNLQG